MSKLNWPDLAAAIREAWHDLWHNAHLDRVAWPEMSDQESQECTEWIGLMLPYWLADLRDHLTETCGVKWNLHTRGRSGATIAPNLPCYARHYLYNRDVIDDGAINFDYSWTRDLDGYNADYRTLAGLLELNRYVKAFCRDLPRLWVDEQFMREE